MKKMKKLNLNKIRIVSLKNLQSISGGNSEICLQTGTNGSLDCEPTSLDGYITCPSSGSTYGGNDGGTLKSADTPTLTCSQILTGCDIEG